MPHILLLLRTSKGSNGRRQLWLPHCSNPVTAAWILRTHTGSAGPQDFCMSPLPEQSFFYTLWLTSFLVLPKCHFRDSAAVTPSLQWPLPVPLLICTVTNIPASRSCTVWLMRTKTVASKSKTEAMGYVICPKPSPVRTAHHWPFTPSRSPVKGGLQSGCLSPRASLAMEEF